MSGILTDRQIKIQYNALKNALESDLKERKLDNDVYRDKVKEYMDLWERRQQVRNDIAERGVTVYSAKSGIDVPNPCIGLEVQISRQMLAIFQSLGFKEKAIKAKTKTGEIRHVL